MLKPYLITSKVAAIFIILSTPMISNGQTNPERGDPSHKTSLELQRNYTICEKLLNFEERNTCFKNLYNECSKTLDDYKSSYLRPRNSQYKFDKALEKKLDKKLDREFDYELDNVLKLKLKIQSKIKTPQ